jgi:glycosyltransferase involved in cell wall biosynthesis
VEILSECYIGICTLLNKGQYHNGDNLATKVYEYMSMGLPVIISDYPYARKVNDEYNCFVLVSPDNIDQIVNAINYLLDNPAIAKQMGQNGRRAVLEKFNWDVEEKKLINLYEDLV